jgi:hypothetical protein
MKWSSSCHKINKKNNLIAWGDADEHNAEAAKSDEEHNEELDLT